MAAWGGHVDVAKVLLEFGAEPKVKDTKHNADAIEWAEFFGRAEVVRLLKQ